MADKVGFLILLGFVMVLTASHARAQTASNDDVDHSTESVPEATQQAEEAPDDSERSEESPTKVDAATDRNPEESDGRLICRRIQVTGTHRRIKRCFTAAQLDQQRQEAQEFIRDRPGRGSPVDGTN